MCFPSLQVVVICVAAASWPHSVSVHPAGTGQTSPLVAHPVSIHTLTRTPGWMIRVSSCLNSLWCFLAGWLCWPGWLSSWAGALWVWRRPLWWWVRPRENCSDGWGRGRRDGGQEEQEVNRLPRGGSLALARGNTAIGGRTPDRMPVLRACVSAHVVQFLRPLC